MQKDYDMVTATIDDYFKANSMSKWVSNYQSARELDYIKARIDSVQEEINRNSVLASASNPQILALKNQNASEILNIHKLAGAGGSASDFYMIFGNSGCLRSNVDASSNKTSLQSVMCDAADENQKFKLDKLSMTDKMTKYPGVYHLHPNNNTDMCLQFTNSGLSVQPCDPTFNKKEQNFAKIDRHVRW